MIHASAMVPGWPVVAATSAGQVSPDEPAAVLGVGGVVCANTWACRSRVRTGMRKREALSIHPELVVVQHDIRRDALRFKSVLQAVDVHVARAAVVEPGRMTFPVQNTVRAVESIKAPVEVPIRRTVGVAGCETHVGCGEGTLAALLAAQPDVFLDVEGPAQFPKRTKAEGTLVGVTPLRRVEARSYLELLTTFGVRTVEDLTNLGTATMTPRFGEMGSLLWQLARGKGAHLPAKVTTSPGIVCARVFEPPLQNVKEAVFSTHSLAEELVQVTGVRIVTSGRLRIDTVFDDGEEFSRP